MNKELILQDFLKLQRETEVLKEYIITNYEELLSALSEEFAEEYDSCDDAQDAFDNLNDYLSNFLIKHGARYFLGTQEWAIDYKENASKDIIESAINEWNGYYSASLKDIDDLTSAINHQVLKDMSYCQYDVHTAFAELCEDIFKKKHPLFVNIGESNPRIDFDI